MPDDVLGLSFMKLKFCLLAMSFFSFILMVGCTKEQETINGLETVDDVCSKMDDIVFKRYCIEHFDYNHNGKISMDEAELITEIDFSEAGIHDLVSLKGIEYMINLRVLKCSGNKLTSLDLSHNTSLTLLYCGNNNLDALDVSKLTRLQILWCKANNLTSLDVSNNPDIKELTCYSNQITTLDVSNNKQLTELSCHANKITNLDLRGATALESVLCNNPNLTFLNVSGLTKLKYLTCYESALTLIDVSGCTNLRQICCQKNHLTTLDLSSCHSLYSLLCQDNNLTTLDVSMCDLANSQTTYVPLKCAMSSLQTLYLKSGWNINHITFNRSSEYIYPNTQIIYK